MLRLGIDGYLNKPFVEEELLLMIKKSLQSLDTLHSFETTLDAEERENLTVFASKFNVELNELIYTYLHSPTFGVEDIAQHLNISKKYFKSKNQSNFGANNTRTYHGSSLSKSKNATLGKSTRYQKRNCRKCGHYKCYLFFYQISRSVLEL